MGKEGKIYWLKKEEGGLSQLPTNEIFYATTILPQVNPSAWSIKISRFEPGKNESECFVSFLFDHAPHEILNTIDSLNVYGGSKIIAIIKFETKNQNSAEREH